MNKRRLLKLADLLEADAKNKKGIKFDMGRWGQLKNSDKPISCNTTACAMGLAALSGAFRCHGLGYKLAKGYCGQIEITMHGRGSGLSSAMKLFAISKDDARYLFTDATDEHGAAGERRIAKRIRDFVTGKASP